MGGSFRGGDRNHKTILFNADQNNYHVMPTTVQLIDQADSNSDLDEQTTDHLFLELLPAGTPSLKSSCQLPVDALLSTQRKVIKAATPNTKSTMPAAQHQEKRLIVVCLFVLFCTSTWLARL